MSSRGIYVELLMHADIDVIWQLTQDPSLHPRWDLRFSSIEPLEELAGGGYRFRYRRAVPGHVIEGTGTSLGERTRPDGTRTSALRFSTTDRLSPLGDGRGYWRYRSTADGTVFITGFDYRPGWGRFLDALVLKRLIGWMTAWSFDRLRIWAETGVEPEHWPVHSVLWFWRPERPRAARCRRVPTRGHAFSAAPEALATLEAP